MQEGEVTHFTSGEFLVLMTLSENGPCLVLTPEKEPDDAQLRRAFITLYQRNLIARNGSSFVLTPEGQKYAALRVARRSAVVTGPKKQRAVLYHTGETFLVLELVATVFRDCEYRVRSLTPEHVRFWLLDSGMVPEPYLQEQDVEELRELYRKNPEDPAGEPIFSGEAYQGCTPAGRWSILSLSGIPILTREDGKAEFYTQESLKRMLTKMLGVEAV